MHNQHRTQEFTKKRSVYILSYEICVVSSICKSGECVLASCVSEFLILFSSLIAGIVASNIHF